MNTPEPTIRVAVDPTNPGQFFACCGLLELAYRLWLGAEGWFENGMFRLAPWEPNPGGSLAELLHTFLTLEPRVQGEIGGVRAENLVAPLGLRPPGAAEDLLTLDAWCRLALVKGAVTAVGTRWQMWSGQQTPIRIWPVLLAAAREQLGRLDPGHLDRLFEYRFFLGGRFGFDPGPAWNALDVGFSPNEQKMRVQSSPVVELLAAVGVQRFRPRMSADGDTFTYATWGGRLSPPAAAAAAGGTLRSPPSGRYLAGFADRGQYAALTYATPLRGDADE